jgi:dolichol-phosphate mannosyltransferase
MEVNPVLFTTCSPGHGIEVVIQKQRSRSDLRSLHETVHPMPTDFAVIVPMANEEREFAPFVEALRQVLDRLGCGRVFLVVDRVSRDRTRQRCVALAARDRRFSAVWAPENRNVVDAYLRGYREALHAGSPLIVEMDAGLSHDPRALPRFLEALAQGNACVFGSRFVAGGGFVESNWRRVALSKVGTLLANGLLGTRLRDMTSGFQGFQAAVVRRFVDYPLLSTAHFYQTELRYLLRHLPSVEVPILYRAPSPSVSRKSIANSIAVLLRYLRLRLQGNAPFIG